VSYALARPSKYGGNVIQITARRGKVFLDTKFEPLSRPYKMVLGKSMLKTQRKIQLVQSAINSITAATCFGKEMASPGSTHQA
jgi:hypothetical protein